MRKKYDTHRFKKGLTLAACVALGLFAAASNVAAAPSIIITSPDPDTVFETNAVTVFMVAKADVGELSHVNVKLDDGSISQAIPLDVVLENGWVGFYMPYTDLVDDIHTFKAFPVDEGGFGFASVDFEVKTEIIVGPPTVEITKPNPTDEITDKDLVTIELNAAAHDGNDELQLLNLKMTGPMVFDNWYHPTADGDGFSITFDEPFDAGTYTATIYATDHSAQTSFDSVTFTVEETIVIPGNLISDYDILTDNYSTRKAVVDVDIPNDADSIRYYINDFLVEDDDNDSCVFRFLQGGTYTVTVEAMDGNSVSETDEVTFSVPYNNISGQYSFRRLNGNKPIVDRNTFFEAGATLPLRINEYEYDNINGPCVINVNGIIDENDRVEEWANYYMYFGSHHGQYIRMAYAANIEGPWKLYNVDGPDRRDRGVLTFGKISTDADDQLLPIGNGLVLENHMSSPEIMVVDGEIILFFHAPWNQGALQKTFAALSEDNLGLNFNDGIVPCMQCNYYGAFVEYDDNFYGSQNQARILTHPDNGEDVINLLEPASYAGYDFTKRYWKRSTDDAMPYQDGLPNGIRHIKLAMDTIDPSVMIATFSCTEDVPERLYYRELDIDANIDKHLNDWVCTGPAIELARAEVGWEGGQYPVIASEPSGTEGKVNQLRDPDIFIDNDGEKYVFYCGEGELAIGVAHLEWVD